MTEHSRGLRGRTVPPHGMCDSSNQQLWLEDEPWTGLAKAFFEPGYRLRPSPSALLSPPLSFTGAGWCHCLQPPTIPVCSLHPPYISCALIQSGSLLVSAPDLTQHGLHDENKTTEGDSQSDPELCPLGLLCLHEECPQTEGRLSRPGPPKQASTLGIPQVQKGLTM